MNEELAARLVAATQRIAVSEGLENVGLRSVTAAVGKSTTAVFQQFGGKDALLGASLEAAFAQDRDFHADLLLRLRGAPRDAETLASIVSFYVLRRSRNNAAQLYLEALYKSRQFPNLAPLLRRWHELRHDFWRALLEPTGTGEMAACVTGYTAAEEVYAAALTDQADYHLLLRGTTGRLFASAKEGEARNAAAVWLEDGVPGLTKVDRAQLGTTMMRLLDQAVRVITDRGAADLSLRRVAADVSLAPSQIVYHFGDFATFRCEALVEALMRGLPTGLDPSLPSDRVASHEGEWAVRLARTTCAREEGQSAGYYVRYARVLGQACLLAKRDETLRSLAMHLRIIEGSGIHHLSCTEWPEEMRLDRDGATVFAIWIKGLAMLDGVLDAACEDDRAPIIAATVVGLKRHGL